MYTGMSQVINAAGNILCELTVENSLIWSRQGYMSNNWKFTLTFLELWELLSYDIE